MKVTMQRKAGRIAIGMILAGIILITTACSNQSSVKQKATLNDLFRNNKEIVIDCFGDSITWGQFVSVDLQKKIANGEVIPSLDDGGQLFEEYGIYISSVYQSDPTYPEKLEMTLNESLLRSGYESRVICVNDGISGDWLTKDSYRRITCDPDIVVILYCGNNFYFDQEYKGTLEANVDALRDAGCLLYFATYPLYPDKAHTEDFANANKYLRKVAKKKNIPLIDTYELFEEAVGEQYDRDDLFSTDLIHLSELGYELLGQYIAQGIFADLEMNQ